jgi:hypothetical protein
MKKTVIAIAVAAALPVAAQADVTLSGSVSSEYKLGSNMVPTIEANLSADSSEVLSSGMAATASFSVLGAKTQGTIGLSGDFGELKAGSAAKGLEDVANSAPNDVTTEDDENADLSGIAYTGSFAGLQVNASKGQFDEDARDDVEASFGDYTGTQTLVQYTTYGASYNFNGLTVTGQNTTEGTNDAVNEFTASYSFGDLTVSGSKASDKANAVVKAAYVASMDDLVVKVSADSSDENAWDLEASYTLGALVVTATDDEEVGGAKISAKYTAGDMSLEVDSDNKVTVGYDMGNADLSMVREKDEGTKVKYTVAF